MEKIIIELINLKNTLKGFTVEELQKMQRELPINKLDEEQNYILSRVLKIEINRLA